MIMAHYSHCHHQLIINGPAASASTMILFTPPPPTRVGAQGIFRSNWDVCWHSCRVHLNWRNVFVGNILLGSTPPPTPHTLFLPLPSNFLLDESISDCCWLAIESGIAPGVRRDADCERLWRASGQLNSWKRCAGATSSAEWGCIGQVAVSGRQSARWVWWAAANECKWIPSVSQWIHNGKNGGGGGGGGGGGDLKARWMRGANQSQWITFTLITKRGGMALIFNWFVRSAINADVIESQSEWISVQKKIYIYKKVQMNGC